MEDRTSEILASKYSEIFVNRFHELEGDWTKPWIKHSNGAHQNLSGSVYRGVNAIVLSLLSSMKGYDLPVWMTLRQANDFGVSITKGSKSIPVVFYDVYIWDTKNRKRSDVTVDEFNKMKPEDREDLKKCVCTKVYYVFNIAQTNFAEVHSVAHDELNKHFGVSSRLVECQVLDEMLSKNAWECPVRFTDEEPAYRYNHDDIVIPHKESFQDSKGFYSTLLHLMSHSTGSEERLDRNIIGSDENYIREELVAEMSSSVLCNIFGLDAVIREDNLRYLKSWINTIEQKPEYIYSIVRDAASAANYICDSIGISQKKGLDITTRLEKIDTVQKKAKEHKEGKVQIRLKELNGSVKVKPKKK